MPIFAELDPPLFTFNFTNTESSNERTTGITGRHWYHSGCSLNNRTKAQRVFFPLGKGTTIAVKQKLHEKFGIRNNVVPRRDEWIAERERERERERKREKEKSVYPLSCWKILQARPSSFCRFFLPAFRPHNTHGSSAVTQEEKRQRVGWPDRQDTSSLKGHRRLLFQRFSSKLVVFVSSRPRTRAPD